MPPLTPAKALQAAESPLVTAEQLAARLEVSKWWIGDRVRSGRIPHVRVGTPPRSGGRDTRAICFTPEQADQITADYEASLIEIVPAGGAA